MSYRLHLIDDIIVEIIHEGELGVDEATLARDEAAKILFAGELS